MWRSDMHYVYYVHKRIRIKEERCLI